MSAALDYRYEHVFRNQGGVAFSTVGNAFLALVIVIMVLQGGSAVWDALAGLVALAGVGITVRTARAGMVARPDGVLIRSLFKTQVVKWSDIDDVTKAPAIFTFNPRAIRVGLRLRDGRVLSTAALSAASSEARLVRDTTDGLRSLLDQHRLYDTK